MNSTKNLRLILFIFLLALPFFLSYFGFLLNVEIYTKILTLSLIIVGLPLVLLFFSLNVKYKDLFKATISGKTYTKPGRVVAIFFSFFLLSFTYSFLLDLTDFIKIGGQIKNEKVIEVRSNPYTFLLRGQSLYLENLENNPVLSIFSPYLARQGDSVNLTYFPRTKLVIQINKIENY